MARNVEDIFPLLPLQQGILFDVIQAPASERYVQQVRCELSGAIEPDRLDAAWQTLVREEPAMRTGFNWTELREPVQYVMREVPFAMRRYDCSSSAPHDRAKEIDRIAAIERSELFDLARPPLLRCALATLTPEKHVLVWTHHHIILDGWSISILAGRLLHCYQEILGGGPKRPRLPGRSQRDFVAWLRQRDRAGAREFWQARLRTVAEPHRLLSVALALERANIFHEHALVLGQDESLALSAAAAEAGVTASAVLYSAWALTAGLFAGKMETIFGVMVSLRPFDLPDIEQRVGLYINTVPLRVKVSTGTSLRTLCQETHAELQAVSAHGFLPFAEIQRLSAVRGTEALCDTLVIIENYPSADDAIGRPGEVRVDNIQSSERNVFPLTIFIVPGRRIQVTAVYNASLFSPDFIARLLAEFRRRLMAFRGKLATKVLALPRILVDPASVGPVCAAEEGSIVSQIWRIAAQQPDATAIVGDGAHVSYRAMTKAADRVADFLAARGAARGSRIGIALSRSPKVLLALLGVMRRGAVYVPIDITLPAERIRFMIGAADVRLILADTDAARVLASVVPETVCSMLDESLAWPVSQGRDPLPVESAYLLFTSGSTGRPKGVEVGHRALANFVAAARDVWGGGRPLCMAVTTISFDIAALEMYVPLVEGGTVAFLSQPDIADPARLIARMEEYMPTLIQATPSLWHLVVSAGWNGSQQARLLAGGEPLPHALAAQLASRGAEVWNLYGPTETTVYSSMQPVKPSRAVDGIAVEPIGPPLRNTQFHVLDPWLRPLPEGSRGELYIGGEGLANGYVGQPLLTAERFVPDPFSALAGARMYCTGDAVQVQSRGRLVFLGRKDYQVKLRGFRIELGEIEAVLIEHDRVDRVVVSVMNVRGEPLLVAHVVLKEATPEAARFLRQQAAARLPAYMIPNEFVILAKLPLTPNGKVDRAALPAPAELVEDVFSVSTSVTPDLEVAVLGAWRTVLNRSEVGLDENFFDVGGHSILMIQLQQELRRRLGRQIEIMELYRTPTVRLLVHALAGNDGPLPPVHERRTATELGRQRQRVRAEAGVA